MARRIYTLVLVFAIMAANAYAQSRNRMNEKSANVKICRSASPKILSDMTFYKADGTNHQKFSYEYDEAGLLTSEVSSNWNSSTNEWRSRQKNDYTYDGQNRLTEDLSSHWHPDTWTAISKKTPIYVDGTVTEELYYAWDQAINNWENATIKYTYTYNAEGFKTEEVQQRKESSSDLWNDPNWKITYTRNPAGQMTEEASFNWSKDANDWVPEGKYVYEYDAAEHQMLVSYYEWDGNQWTNGNKVICIYDNDGDVERASYYRSFDDSSLDAYCIYTYLLSDETSAAAIETTLFTVSPNPATSHVNIKATPALLNKTAYIYDAAGKLAKTVPLENEVTNVDISQLSNGIYFIKVENLVSKIVKQ